MDSVINPQFPIASITSVEQLMEIAVGMENEAATRYEQLAEAMERRREPALAETFRELAELERAHEGQLQRWAAREGRARPQPAKFGWQLPESFGSEGDGDEALVLTPYRALSIAVRNEERAFAFYSYLAALAPSGAVQERAEALAREELAHVDQLRRMRRAAYHRARGPILRPQAFDFADWRSLAAGLERAAAELDGAVAAIAEKAGIRHSAEVLFRLSEMARKRGDFLAPASASPRLTATLDGARASGVLQAGGLTPLGAIRLSLRNAEEIHEAYMAVAEKAQDEQVLAEAQDLAGRALERLALVRSLLAEVEDDNPPVSAEDSIR